MNDKEKHAILEIMAILETNCSCGGVGEDGPTLEEMEEYWDREGEPCGNNEYDICQQTWRRLERLVKE